VVVVLVLVLVDVVLTKASWRRLLLALLSCSLRRLAHLLSGGSVLVEVVVVVDRPAVILGVVRYLLMERSGLKCVVVDTKLLALVVGTTCVVLSVVVVVSVVVDDGVSGVVGAAVVTTSGCSKLLTGRCSPCF